MTKLLRGWAAAAAVGAWTAAAALGLGLGLGATQAGAVTLDQYDSRQLLLDVNGYVIGLGFIDTAVDDGGTPADVDDDGKVINVDDDGAVINLVGLLLESTASLAADTTGDGNIDLGVDGATEISIMAQMIELLFEQGGFGYLVTIDSTGNINFLSPTLAQVDFLTDAFVDVDARITLERLSTAVIPLPAGLPLLLGALGALALLRRRPAA